MTPGLTCASCHRALAPQLVRRTDEGFVHLACPINRREANLPWAPLEPWHPHFSLITDQRLLDAAIKARRRGRISVSLADAMAVALGLHPGLIWDDWWVQEVAA